MAAYAVLIAIAFFVLHGKALYAVLILFGGLALKTLIAAKRDHPDSPDVPAWNTAARNGFHIGLEHRVFPRRSIPSD